MKIHEYQAREILKAHNVPVPVAEMAESADAAKAAAEKIPTLAETD